MQFGQGPLMKFWPQRYRLSLFESVLIPDSKRPLAVPRHMRNLPDSFFTPPSTGSKSPSVLSISHMLFYKLFGESIICKSKQFPMTLASTWKWLNSLIWRVAFKWPEGHESECQIHRHETPKGRINPVTLQLNPCYGYLNPAYSTISISRFLHQQQKKPIKWQEKLSNYISLESNYLKFLTGGC